jgi:hypothetical protein
MMVPMRIVRATWVAVVGLGCVVAIGCGNGDTAPQDLGVADLRAIEDMTILVDLRVVSSCGQPGDPGNEVGVGKFCSTQAECTSGTVCTHAFNEDTYFCTTACAASGIDPSCGSGAYCQCSTGGCGCVPGTCASLPHD